MHKEKIHYFISFFTFSISLATIGRLFIIGKYIYRYYVVDFFSEGGKKWWRFFFLSRTNFLHHPSSSFASVRASRCNFFLSFLVSPFIPLRYFWSRTLLRLPIIRNTLLSTFSQCIRDLSIVVIVCHYCYFFVIFFFLYFILNLFLRDICLFRAGLL